MGYTYTVPSKGDTEKSNASLPPLGVKPVAWVHAHGAAVDENKKISDYNRFSGEKEGMTSEDYKKINEVTPENADIAISNKYNQIAYVATPNGSLKKYDPQTGDISTISTELPSDQRTNDHLNTIVPTQNKHNHINNRLSYYLNVLSKALGTRAYTNYYQNKK